MEDKKHARIKDAIQSKQYELAIELLSDEPAEQTVFVEATALYIQSSVLPKSSLGQ